MADRHRSKQINKMNSITSDEATKAVVRRDTEEVQSKGNFDAAQPMRYKFGKTVRYVTSDGRVIEASKIRKDSKVRVHNIKDGDDMVVDKVIVTRDRD